MRAIRELLDCAGVVAGVLIVVGVAYPGPRRDAQATADSSPMIEHVQICAYCREHGLAPGLSDPELPLPCREGGGSEPEAEPSAVVGGEAAATRLELPRAFAR